MAKNHPVIALDLDFTLARFQGGYPGIFDVVAPFGVPRAAAELELQNSIYSPQGLNLKRYAQNLFPHDTKRALILADALEAHFEKEFDWYPGVREILENWKKSGITLIVITAGAREFQSAKIRKLGFAFESTYITNILQENGKAQVIAQLLKKYSDQNLFYVDDKASELVHIAEDPCVDMARVSLYQISHGDRPMEEKISKKGVYQKISSLEEIYG